MKLMALLALISLIGIGASQTPIGGTIPAKVMFEMETHIPNTFGQMSPLGGPYTTGNVIEVTANCPFQIVTTCNPSDGKMASVANPAIKLHHVMSLTLDGTPSYPLSAPVVRTFPRPTFYPFPVPTTFKQVIGWDDAVLALGDYYLMTATFTVTSI